MKHSARSTAETELDFTTSQLNYQRALAAENYAEAEIFIKQSIRIVEQRIGRDMAWAHQARENLAAVQELRRINRLIYARDSKRKQRECARKVA